MKALVGLSITAAKISLFGSMSCLFRISMCSLVCMTCSSGPYRQILRLPPALNEIRSRITFFE
jgi:hypothetical protein